MKWSILALDLGSLTGYAFGPSSGVMISGTWNFQPRRYDGGGMRYLRFERMLDDFQEAHPIDEVVFEEVRRHAGTDAAHVYGGLMATLTAWCEREGVPYEGVPVGSIKKYVTGKGNASKAAVMAAVEEATGVTPGDDNEADAIALLLFRRGVTEPQ